MSTEPDAGWTVEKINQCFVQATIKMNRGFTADKPDSIGLWEFKCEELDGRPERVAITEREGLGNLVVHDDALGITPLDIFHDGLTKISWRKIA